MTIIAMTAGAISVYYRSGSGTSGLKAEAHLLASGLRNMRSSALAEGGERVAKIDVGERVIRFDGGRATIKLDKATAISVTAADSERRSDKLTGVRFYPNGSSTGGTIRLQRDEQVYEVRINWLTGRVQTSVVN